MPDAELYFITGADALADIFTWKRGRRAVRAGAPVRGLHPAGPRDGPADAGRDPVRQGDDGRDPGAGDLLDRLPRPAPAAGNRSGTSSPTASSSTSPSTTSTPRLELEHKVTATDHAVELVVAAARAASDKLAQQIIAFDVSEQLAITDAFVLASATNDRQVKLHRRRGRGQAARDRRQADPPRGRARRPLGAHRLRRDRRARAARGGAAVLRPRAALARLPDHPAARGRHRHQPWLTSSCCATAGPTGTPRAASRGRPTPSSTTLGHAQAEAVAPVLAALDALRAVVLRLRPRPHDGVVRRRGDCGLTPTYDARLREYSLGPREGLFHHEFEADAPAEYAEFVRANWDAVAGRREARRGRGPDGRRARRGRRRRVPTDGVALVVSHGAAIRTAVAALLGWPSERGACAARHGQLRLGGAAPASRPTRRGGCTPTTAPSRPARFQLPTTAVG